jgi:hypothetical protein
MAYGLALAAWQMAPVTNGVQSAVTWHMNVPPLLAQKPDGRHAAKPPWTQHSGFAGSQSSGPSHSNSDELHIGFCAFWQVPVAPLSAVQQSSSVVVQVLAPQAMPAMGRGARSGGPLVLRSAAPPPPSPPPLGALEHAAADNASAKTTTTPRMPLR